MSREIKFRAFCLPEKKMYGDGFAKHRLGAILESENYGVMQFTGLRDANGVEIYEGDVCRLSYAPRATADGIIGFEGGMFIFTTKQAKPNKSSIYHCTIESGNAITVLGNIYEHPYLLDGSK